MKTKSLFLFILGFSYLSLAQSFTTGVVNLSSTPGLAMSVKLDIGSNVTMTLVGPSGRWFSLGFGAENMEAETDVVGVHSAGTLSNFDAKLIGYAAPVADVLQNWTITSNQVVSGVRTIVATRPLDTGDANDYTFSAEEGTLSLIWARGSSNSFSYGYHGSSNRGVVNATFTPLVSSSPLALQLFLDGYYIYGSNPSSMRAARYINLLESGSANPGANTDVDLITVELRSAANLNVVAYSVSSILQTNGSLQCTFPAGAFGNSYYIVVKHRSSIPLWSANPVTISGSTTLNFSNNSANAFTDGSVAPMKTLVSGLYGTRLGELNGDGYLDGVDYSTFESNVYSSAYGGLFLLDGDLNGDSYVDASDFAVFNFNSTLGSYEQRP
jgi:hypothetical protein